MCKQISTEYILGSALYFNQNGISISRLNQLEQKIYKENTDLIIDISRSAIVSVVESCNEYFKLENDFLLLEEYYLNNITRIKNRFFDVLDESLKTCIKCALLSD